MSKKVRSDGSTQHLLLKAIKDPAISKEQMAKFLHRKNLNKCNKTSLQEIQSTWKSRWPGIDLPTNNGEFVLILLQEFIKIREKQSPNRQQLNDYSLLELDNNPEPDQPILRPGEAKPIDHVQQETFEELIFNLKKSMQVLDCGGTSPREYLLKLFPEQYQSVDRLLIKLTERSEAIRNNRRWNILKDRIRKLEKLEN